MALKPLISVIDDDDSLRVALVRLICSLGHAASGHGSAEDFLASGEAGRARCIVTDIQLPGMSGIALKRVLDDDGRQVPVIMITALSDVALLAKASASGAVCLLKKPFEAAALMACLNQALAS